MSPEQQEQIQEIMVQMRQGMLQQAQGDLSRMLGESSGNGRFDREATQAEALTPELKSQMADMQKKAGDRIRQQVAQGRQQAAREIGKILTRKQRETFNRMLGKPFDPTKPGGGGDPRAASDTRSTDQPEAESPSGTGRAPRKKVVKVKFLADGRIANCQGRCLSGQLPAHDTAPLGPGIRPAQGTGIPKGAEFATKVIANRQRIGQSGWSFLRHRITAPNACGNRQQPVRGLGYRLIRKSQKAIIQSSGRRSKVAETYGKAPGRANPARPRPISSQAMGVRASTAVGDSSKTVPRPSAPP